MAWPEGDGWVAVCVDLSLAAQGATAQEARARLHEQMVDYVTEALTVDAEHAEALLSRRAPLYDRLRYQFWRAVSRRPRVRRGVGRAPRGLGVAIAHKLAYSDPLPIRVA